MAICLIFIKFWTCCSAINVDWAEQGDIFGTFPNLLFDYFFLQSIGHLSFNNTKTAFQKECVHIKFIVVELLSDAHAVILKRNNKRWIDIEKSKMSLSNSAVNPKARRFLV